MPAGALLLLVVAVPQALSCWPAVAPLQVADLVASIAVEPLRLVWICGRRWSSYSTRPHCWSAVELVAWPVVAVLHRAELLAGGRAVGLVSGRTAASGLAAAAELVAWPVVAVLHQAALLALPAVTVLQVPNGWRCRRSRSGTRSSREAATCRPASISRVPSGGNSQRAR